MRNSIVLAVLGGVSLAFASVQVQAQEVVVDDEEGIVVHERFVEPDDDMDIDDDVPGPRVYGWAAERPLDCGAYHYWDGDACVDARHVPPDTGYKD